MIHAVFFLSGISALLFQHVWFRQAGLVFGNSVWASSLVLSSFMAGLAVGNGLATGRWPQRKSPLLLYSFLELTVALTGVGLVFILPALGEGLVPLLGRLVKDGFGLGALRFTLAFLLLVVPTSAMGMTLPVLVGRTPTPERFGVTLGRLYGWNTLGAVLGAVAGEAFLYERIGVRNTAFVAGALNLVAASLSLALARTEKTAPDPPAPSPNGNLGRAEVRLLFLAALAGGCLLALEIVWTRFLLLFLFGTALAFAIMLALALAGIAVGSLIAARAPRLCQAPPAVPVLSLLAAISVTGSYAAFADVVKIEIPGMTSYHWGRAVLLSAALILPTAIVSGALFTSLGAALGRTLASSRAAGLLTLANTSGAMVGAMAGGFLLLPMLGMERSFWLIASMYFLLATVSPGFTSHLRSSLSVLGLSAIGLLFTALFPAGLMQRTYLRGAVLPFVEMTTGSGPTARVAGLREGLTETITYLDTILEGERLHTRLITNSFSMSGTFFDARRYMETFVYLPVAIHPNIRRALLISYGVGVTARALTQTSEIEKIDVVDISRDILEMAHLAVAPGDESPLGDPRVVTHVEDGRFFLQTVATGYDLITSEPPPPHLGGVVNLYSLQYFNLIKKKLNPGGIVSYWLPVHALSDNDARAISSAFCAAFPDCTLWKGMNLDWILLGTNGLKEAVSVARFKEQWGGKALRSLREIGLEVPEQLGALFMAEGANFPSLESAAPLEDNYPGRLAHSPPVVISFNRWRQELMNSAVSRQRFEASAFVKRVWPEAVRAATLPYFEVQKYYDDMLAEFIPNRKPVKRINEAAHLLNQEPLSTLPAMLLGSSGDIQILINRLEARGGALPPWLDEHLGVRDLANRRFESAEGHFRDALARNPSSPDAAKNLVLTLCIAGKRAKAEEERAKLRPPIEKEWDLALGEVCRARAGDPEPHPAT